MAKVTIVYDISGDDFVDTEGYIYWPSVYAVLERAKEKVEACVNDVNSGSDYRTAMLRDGNGNAIGAVTVEA